MAKAQTKSVSQNFIKEAIAELKKVSWPTRQEALRLTGMILIAAIISGAIIGLVDFFILQGLEAII
ncbi:MAG TPA: preprotein translocase subunit SecE [bacterium]|nr:preprotein translocase subunit SecE [bacterium]